MLAKGDANDLKIGANMQSTAFVVAIIPVFNEARNIANIVDRVTMSVSKVIVIDDGSIDNTYSTVPRGEKISVLRNRKNLGKGAALKRGIIEAMRLKPDIFITIDGDGQHEPEDIPKLIQPIRDNQADIVVGSRYLSAQDEKIPRYRKLGLTVIGSLNRVLTSSNLKDSQSGFRAYSKDVIELLLEDNSTGYGFETANLSSAEAYGFRIMEVGINIRYTGLGMTSKRNSVLHGLDIVSMIAKVAIERRPLVFFGLAGLLSFAVAAVTVIEIITIFNDTRYFSVPLGLIAMGFTFMGSMLIMFSLILHILRKIKHLQINMRS